MKGVTSWSFHPYKPFLFDTGDLYVCRIFPGSGTVGFTWLPLEDTESYTVHLRRRAAEGEPENAYTEYSVTGTTFVIDGLEDDTDYEFFVSAGEKTSRVRLARTGFVPGDVVVNYLHPDDRAYSFSGNYLCSPSLVRHPDGYRLASMDVFKGGAPQDLTLIFRSDDDGATWSYVSELFPCFWGRMFIHTGSLYMLSVNTEYGDLLIGKSTDGGKTFSRPVTLFYGSNGKNGETGVHKNPTPVVIHDGRIWNTMEWGSWGRGYHAVMVMSAPVGSDLLNPDSWEFTPPVPFDKNWEGVPKGETPGNLEGVLVEVDGTLHNFTRFMMHGLERNWGLITDYIVTAPDQPVKYNGLIEFPCNHTKFDIKYDSVSKTYYAIGSRIYDGKLPSARNLLSLLTSPDCKNWTVVEDLLDYRHESADEVGFQYVNMQFDGEDIVYLCRTAINGAHNFHDSNYSTFHRIANFRRYSKNEQK